MAEPERAVFLDPSQRRRQRLLRAGAVLGLIGLASLAIFLLSLYFIPYLPPVPGVCAPLRHALKRPFTPLPDRVQKLRRFLHERSRRALLRQVERDRAAARPAGAPPVVGAFYATWQEEGIHSLRANAGRLTHLFPEWLHISADGSGLDLADFDLDAVPRNNEVLRIARGAGLAIMPILNNARDGVFDARPVHRLLQDPARQKKLAARLREWLLANRFAGVNLDFENLAADDYARLPAAVARVRKVLAPAGLKVSLDIEAADTPLDWAAAARACDLAIIMSYDEHDQRGGPGAIASFRFFDEVLRRALRDVPRAKLVMGLGNYAYDWTEGKPPAQAYGYQRALLAARDNNPDARPADLVDFDPRTLNPTFNYEDENGAEHEVWMLDAVTAGNQWRMAQGKGVRGAALWNLGAEDPSLWTFFNRERLLAPPDLAQLAVVKYPYDIEYVGNGEILTVEAMPEDGRRRLAVDRATGFVL
ncbi:MAG: glycosyl hydrolase family 18 protein, partial [Elusimicrobia bacterium]|nr:glycosyl hydrolase family 18 protein [Elusimicrobiota bacterium]